MTCKRNLPADIRPPSTARSDHVQQRTENCFPFDVIVFAMLPAPGIFRETVSLLDVIVRCDLTMNQPMNGRTIAGKMPAIL